jgi:hypothetical protein
VNNREVLTARNSFGVDRFSLIELILLRVWIVDGHKSLRWNNSNRGSPEKSWAGFVYVVSIDLGGRLLAS